MEIGGQLQATARLQTESASDTTKRSCVGRDMTAKSPFPFWKMQPGRSLRVSHNGICYK